MCRLHAKLCGGQAGRCTNRLAQPQQDPMAQLPIAAGGCIVRRISTNDALICVSDRRGSRCVSASGPYPDPAHGPGPGPAHGHGRGRAPDLGRVHDLCLDSASADRATDCASAGPSRRRAGCTRHRRRRRRSVAAAVGRGRRSSRPARRACRGWPSSLCTASPRNASCARTNCHQRSSLETAQGGHGSGRAVLT